MSRTRPASRDEFVAYCLRRLGAPVIRIDVAPEQVEDLVDEAVYKFQYEHFNGSIQAFLPFTVTAESKTKGFPVDESIIGIQEVLDSGIVGGSSKFSLQYQLTAPAYEYALKGGGMLTYMLQMQYLETLKMIAASGKAQRMRYNRHMDRLFIDSVNLEVGQVYIAECTVALDPDEHTQMWNDPFLKRYATALIKRQWGNNLRKLQNVQLIGGVTIDAQQILTEAQEEIDKMHEEMLLEHQEPILQMLMG